MSVRNLCATVMKRSSRNQNPNLNTKPSSFPISKLALTVIITQLVCSVNEGLIVSPIMSGIEITIVDKTSSIFITYTFYLHLINVLKSDFQTDRKAN